MDDNKIVRHDEHDLDAEKARDMPSEIPMAFSYTHCDRFVERLVHPASALSFCLLSFAILFLGLHILWIAVWYADYKTLVPLAFHYNKATALPAETTFNFNVKGLCVVMSAGGASIMVGLGALAFARLAHIVPRKTLLEYVSRIDQSCISENRLSLMEQPLPLAPFMKYMFDFTTIQITFSLFLALYLQFFYEIEPAEASGCHSYTNSKGKLFAKCTLESAACYTQDWPDDVERGNAGQLCSEAVSFDLNHYCEFTKGMIEIDQAPERCHRALCYCVAISLQAH